MMQNEIKPVPTVTTVRGCPASRTTMLSPRWSFSTWARPSARRQPTTR